ncbi:MULTISPECIES: xanthine dehydrogenase family protein molybdopterin-binding subunit [unclassified Ruegeria]|uniref:xanthine dehydrogenase family protein molybdopterin-binding subunit n=1 Tax=unclassified Ruegeria TaxID=2625375 RepID=UPI001ADC1E05|nr:MULTISPECIES: xanthine dehydrogenase family protein molybdopterin-binding subunit [unclassified Ruegeria]MBO9411376.1 xanthine dehydrogenase family protein molybdopterin-binding subunit [Ruegeria sp. R8_1]MBO9416062.1 xanthine dehydrogenase family protein molybdopterin-binding subunit [Ruegeria sp. R8_2]
MALDDRKTDFTFVGTRPNRPDGLDKVTGRAKFGADMSAPGMLHGAILRSPHAHARIVKIDTSKAEALKDVKAVVTRADFADVPFKPGLAGEFWNVLENVMAGEKALYDGHAVAAVAATSALAARDALKLIEVEYEVLPHVTDVDKAMAPDAPVIREGAADYSVPEGMHPNVVRYHESGHGDVDAGFAEADLVLEDSFVTEATHQGYIEPHACLGLLGSDGKGELWCTTQGHWIAQKTCAALLGIETSQLRVTASEIGGGFGGKTTVFIEPVALALSRKANRPVKLVMTRSEVFRATGPTASASMDIKIGMKKDGTITAARGEFRLQGGAFPGAPGDMTAMCAFAAYNLTNVKQIGYDVMANRPKQAAYRAPGAPMGAFAVESVIDEMCNKLGLDPIEVRLKNAAHEGTKASYGPRYERIGLVETLEAAKAHPHYSAPLKPGQGRGVSCGFWFNHGGETSVTLALSEDGSAQLMVGTPDIGGSRASMALMAAEVLGIPYENIRVTVADTASLGYNDVSHGSRVTYASGLATIKAAKHAVEKLCERAAAKWDIPVEAVKWENGCAVPSGPNAGDFDPMPLADITAKMGRTGGPISGHFEATPEGAGVSFGTHIVDAEVDPETGKTTITRYTVIQDAGKAIHPTYVEGQFQGGAAQGIGWALNEEYIYGEDGRLQNSIFLDYRIPVASDLPMIDTVIVEVPNPGHPFGVRGVGETGIVPPLAAIANAVSNAAGVRMKQLPMSPPRILAALKDNG